ncbi:drug:proton antiporter [Burkholderia singularis]|uniref:Drug:proton antiporter n=1 Tax=Burkholderia singularis TaxID=1503053 RepID=A0A103E2A0_9BURK|nr:GNAT family N-acetyltransferase [Burkholderia singularis]KVE27002.1 drug:proton antiporter [Burkholderia singularis]
MDWTCSEFRHLNSNELYMILRARNAVLVVEEAHSHLDIDGKDTFAIHVFAIDKNGEQASIAAYARLLPGDEIDPETTIDKILTSTAHRDDNTIDALIEHALAAAYARWPDAPVRVQAPVHHEAFYNRFGFRKVDGPFLEHGVPYMGLQRAAQHPSSTTRNLLNLVGAASSDASHADDETVTKGERYAFAARLSADSGANR